MTVDSSRTEVNSNAVTFQVCLRACSRLYWWVARVHLFILPRYVEIHTGFLPFFLFVSRTCHNVRSTGRRYQCWFLSQLPKCKNVPKSPWLPWVHAGPIPHYHGPNKHESSMSRTTHTTGNPLSNLFNSPSPTTELQYHQWISSLEVYMLRQTRVSTWKYTIRRKETWRKETRHAYLLVQRYKDINLIIAPVQAQQGRRVPV